nr:hypothetical protein [Novosphingobium sp. 9U]
MQIVSPPCIAEKVDRDLQKKRTRVLDAGLRRPKNPDPSFLRDIVRLSAINSQTALQDLAKPSSISIVPRPERRRG